MSLISFASDNHSGIHPVFLEEMIKVNQGFAPSYDQDEWSIQLKKMIKNRFKAFDSALVFNGTAANVICLQLCLESFEAVLCTDVSHLNVDECGAPEKIAGVKLISLLSKNGKFIIEDIESALIRRGDQHFSQIKMISITQPTEYGTLYSLDELNRIHEICKKNNLFLHIDGARLANAASTLNVTLEEITEKADVLSFGGAKNGLMMGEFVIQKNPLLKKGLKFFRKQSLQLPSKTRFLSAPYLKYLENNLWLKIAQHENDMALYLRDKIQSLGFDISQETQANSVFCHIPQKLIKPLREKFFFYVWNEKTFEVRLMTSFSTTKEQIDAFYIHANKIIKDHL
jgi:threonine aldolase